MTMSFHANHTDWSCFDCLKDNAAIVFKKEEVKVYSLDTVFLPRPESLLLKTDTQGHELAVLKGAHRLITAGRIPYLILEFDPSLLRKAGTDPLQFLEWLAAVGYNCFDLSWEPMKPDTKPYPLVMGFQDFAPALFAHASYGYTDLFCIWSK